MIAAAAVADSGTSALIPCGPGHVQNSPTTLWPPNHKMRTETIRYFGDNDGDQATLHVDSISKSPTAENPSNARTSPDWTGVGHSATGPDSSPLTVTVQLRSERNGGDKSGRTYTITVTCSENGVGATPTEGPESGTATLTVHVPHDRGHR